jgi:superfamily I DNA and RNA helicase
MLENEAHWRDLGYRVVNPPFKPGALTRIERVEDSSPSSISRNSSTDEIISVRVFSNASEEIASVVKQIDSAIRKEGLRPDDVLVVTCDDRYARIYLSAIATELQKKGIATNNLHIDTYSLQDFVRDNSVTLSTVHKAKGNEAYQVYLVGVDALFQPPTVRNRNMVFTAMTRAKAWLGVSGVGQFAQVCQRELEEAVRHLPGLEFRYPSEADLQIMKRDLRESPEQRVEAIIQELQSLMPDADIQKLLAQKSFNFDRVATKKGTKPSGGKSSK